MMKIKVFLTVLALFVSFIIVPSTDGAFAQDNDPVRLESNGHYYEVIFVPLPPEGITFPEAKYRAPWSSFHGVQGHLATIHIVQEQMLINDLRLDLHPYENTCWN